MLPLRKDQPLSVCRGHRAGQAGPGTSEQDGGSHFRASPTIQPTGEAGFSKLEGREDQESNFLVSLVKMRPKTLIPGSALWTARFSVRVLTEGRRGIP